MPEGALRYHLNSVVSEINSEDKSVKTSSGETVSYDILVLATGSDALLPRHTPGHDAQGVFVYRTIEDLQRLIQFSSTRKGTTGAVVGGGLLGLEAAHAMMDLENFAKVKLVERNRWVLSRQLDGDAGGMVDTPLSPTCSFDVYPLACTGDAHPALVPAITMHFRKHRGTEEISKVGCL